MAMYREKDLQDCLYGLVGFRQTVNPDYPQLTPGLLQSDSGLYFQDEHPLINIENIDQALKNYDQYNFALYEPATEYAIGDRRKYNDKIYESLQDANQGNAPDASPLFWAEFNILSQKLDNVVRAAITKVFSAVFAQKEINQNSKELLENVLLFDGAGSLQNKEIKTGRFVGMAIRLSDNRDITSIIRRVGTQFTEANPNFKLYVFHSSQQTPIQIVDLALTKSNSFEWTKPATDINLIYNPDNHNAGGVFYIGYYETDLVGQAINRDYNFDTGPACSHCNRSWEYWTAWTEYMTVTPFEVLASDLVGILPADGPGGAGIPFIWDIDKTRYPVTKSFGLNFDLSVRCDVTDFFCRERRMFTNAIIKQVAVDVLNLIAYSTRNNPISKETKELAMYELNNKPEYTPGAVKQRDKALAAISFNVSDLNDKCLPCEDKYGSSWGVR